MPITMKERNIHWEAWLNKDCKMIKKNRITKHLWKKCEEDENEDEEVVSIKRDQSRKQIQN